MLKLRNKLFLPCTLHLKIFHNLLLEQADGHQPQCLEGLMLIMYGTSKTSLQSSDLFYLTLQLLVFIFVSFLLSAGPLLICTCFF